MRETVINTNTAAVYQYRNLPARISNSRCLTFHQAAPVPSAKQGAPGGQQALLHPSGCLTG
jgi:hypothetical protein